mgnify:CR=1 FL=1|tara:strand:+ start:31199 stop:32323 length:1125 start_codon:yes stop_codon:yes gene_type:complete
MTLIKSLNEELQEFTAAALVPETIDWHGDIVSQEEVRKACRNFNKNCLRSNIGHKVNVSSDLIDFVESYTTAADMTIKSKDEETVYPEGTWFITAKVKSKSLWDDIQTGKYTGLSVGCDALVQKIRKAKAANEPSELGVELKRRLYNFDFSQDEHHVALVDEAANATKIAVFKSKEPQQEENMDPKEELETLRAQLAKATEDKNKSEVNKAKDEAVELQKAKDAADKENVALKKEKEDMEKQLADIKKAKEEELKTSFIEKAKGMSSDNAEVFGDVLYKCSKSLNEDEFKVLNDQLAKITNVETNTKVLKAVGEGKDTGEVKTASEVFEEKVVEIAKSEKVSRPEAIMKSREYFKQNDMEVYNEVTYGEKKENK